MYIKKSILFSVLSCMGFLSANSLLQIKEIQGLYQQPIVLVESLRLEHASNDYKALVSLCSCFNQPFSKLIKQLRCDIHCVQKAAKMNGCECYQLSVQLKGLCSFLKKHKFIYEAITFHKHIVAIYQPLFDMVDNDKDLISYIDAHRELFNIGVDDQCFLKKFLKDVKLASHKISKFEDFVHADYIDLKLQNYVYKIELIKLRNAILFDKRYKG